MILLYRISRVKWVSSCVTEEFCPSERIDGFYNLIIKPRRRECPPRGGRLIYLSSQRLLIPCILPVLFSYLLNRGQRGFQESTINMRALAQRREGQLRLMASPWQPANRGPPGSLMMGCPRAVWCPGLQRRPCLLTSRQLSSDPKVPGKVSELCLAGLKHNSELARSLSPTCCPHTSEVARLEIDEERRKKGFRR